MIPLLKRSRPNGSAVLKAMMNKARREALSKIHTQLDDLKAELEAIKDEEQEYYDNMPESLQGGDKGQTAEQAISLLEDAINQIDEALSNIDGASE